MPEDFDTSKRSTLHDVQIHEPVIEPKRAKKLYLIIGIAVVVLLIAYGVYAMVTSGKEATDDSQVAADVVPIASRVAGQVVAVHVVENQPVHRGDLISEIDPRDAEVKVSQAQSDLDTARAQAAQADANATVLQATARGGLQTAQGAVQSSKEAVDVAASTVTEARAAITRAEANAQKAASDWKRAEELGGKGDISHAQVDAARAANEAAQADVAQARARLRETENQRQAANANVQQAQGRLTGAAPVGAQVQAALALANLAHAKVHNSEASLQAAQLTLSYTKIYAPVDGIASRLAVHAGALVAPGQAIVQLVPSRTYIIANFKETQVRAMRPGQRAKIRIDALGRDDFEGRVESLSGGTGATFSLLPPDNASGNFVKVVQRIPVRISWNGPTADRVPVGSSADVTVLTK
jgi:membrane fusion protein (multidrug efflux system)